MGLAPKPPQIPNILRLAQDYANLAAEYHQHQQRISNEISLLRGEMRSSFAALERKNSGTARGVSTGLSDRPRSYTIPTTDTGSVDLDRCQDRLDKLERERNEARIAAAAVERHVQQTKADADAKLNRWSKRLAVLVAIGTLLGMLAGAHFLHI
jgi:hypothetical protein